MSDDSDLGVGQAGDDGQLRVDELLLEGESDAVLDGVDRIDPRLDIGANLELLLGVLELDVRVVQRPDNSIDVAGDGDEEGRVAEAFDGSFDNLADLDVRNTKESLLEDGGLEGELNESVERRVSDNTSAVDAADLPRARLGDGGEVVVRNARDLREEESAMVASTETQHDPHERRQ